MKKFEVLIVDDDQVCAMIAKKIISLHFDKNEIEYVLVFLKPLDALNHLEAIDISRLKSIIILLDINMPVINGWQFLTRLAQLDPSNQIGVFMLSSSIWKSDHDKAMRHTRVVDFFIKPLALKHVSRIRDYLRSRIS